jgi:hypothetical protein
MAMVRKIAHHEEKLGCPLGSTIASKNPFSGTLVLTCNLVCSSQKWTNLDTQGKAVLMDRYVMVLISFKVPRLWAGPAVTSCVQHALPTTLYL